MEIVFLVEEISMKIFLEAILPNILPDGVSFLIIPHTGKTDLRKSIPHKLEGWTKPKAKFVIVHDQDANDCIALKKELEDLCKKYSKDVLIRIPCHELEAWYFGDLVAVGEAYDMNLVRFTRKAKYRNPDMIQHPKEELKKIVPKLQQINGAQKIGANIVIERNTSKSFQVFVSGVRRLCGCENYGK